MKKFALTVLFGYLIILPAISQAQVPQNVIDAQDIAEIAMQAAINHKVNVEMQEHHMNNKKDQALLAKESALSVGGNYLAPTEYQLGLDLMIGGAVMENAGQPYYVEGRAAHTVGHYCYSQGLIAKNNKQWYMAIEFFIAASEEYFDAAEAYNKAYTQFTNATGTYSEAEQNFLFAYMMAIMYGM